MLVVTKDFRRPYFPFLLQYRDKAFFGAFVMKILDDEVHEMKAGAVNLRKECPISMRHAIKEAFPFILAFIAILGLSVGLSYVLEDSLGEETLVRFQTFAAIIILISFLVALGKFLFEAVEHAYYSYGIEAGHFVISKGIFLKRRGSFPLSRITDVYLDRTFLDFVFGLYSLHFSTPTMSSGAFARIDGLTLKSAMRLQEKLTDCLDSPIDVEMGSHGVPGQEGSGFSEEVKAKSRRNKPFV